MFVEVLGEANRELYRYDGMVRTLINPDMLLSPFMTQEAVLSFKIEGSQTTIDEAYEQDAKVSFSEHKEEDIYEITVQLCVSIPTVSNIYFLYKELTISCVF